MCSQYLSKQINKQHQTHKIAQIHSETVFNVCSLLMDDTFQPVTPLVSEMTYNVSKGTLNPTNHTYQ